MTILPMDAGRHHVRGLRRISGEAGSTRSSSTIRQPAVVRQVDDGWRTARQR
jgi:hypothetical protein